MRNLVCGCVISTLFLFQHQAAAVSQLVMLDTCVAQESGKMQTFDELLRSMQQNQQLT